MFDNTREKVSEIDEDGNGSSTAHASDRSADEGGETLHCDEVRFTEFVCRVCDVVVVYTLYIHTLL